jgi:hypothetical protein
MTNNEIKFNREDFHKELDLIQGCITRMAQNSFMIKGWAFTLVAAIFALTADKINLIALCYVGIFIMLSFWILDAFFLKQEKLYRFKYEWVIVERPKGNNQFMFDLNPYKKAMWLKDRKEPKTISAMLSKPYTLLLFYGCPILIGVSIILYEIYK